ncbi:MAG: leucine-rich repeat protein, partial [Muribaculaceae bacterium]|nr:leucine-rich repeat protein [Muribaculaceae bacterium]
IGNSAFYGCSSLTSLSIPASVTSIGDYAFYGCSSLDSLSIPASVTSIGNSAFYNCSSLTSLSIPASVTSIGNSAFYGCSSLTSLSIPASVTSIGDYAFYSCSSLDSLSIPASVTSIGNFAFDGCSALKDINLENGETELTLGYNNSSQYYGIFYDCPLEKIHIGRNLSYENSSTYSSPLYNQNKLTDVTIGENVTSLGYALFYGCSSLTSLSIPASVTSIGNYAFNGCSALKDINLENGETELTLGYNNSSKYYGIFYDCPLEKIHIGRNLSYKNSSTYNSPLYKQNKLTDVTIGENVTSLGYALFYGCSSLASLSIPASVTSIGNYAFYGCSSLASLSIPASVTSIGNSAFYNCSSLTSLSIPASVTSVGNYAFNGCSALKDINLENGETELTLGYNNSSQYYGIFYDCPLEKIHIGRNLSYENSSTYSSPLYNQNKLTDITIGEKVTSLGYALFYGCSSLASVTIPTSVNSIGDYAFDGCLALREIKLEDGETELVLGHGKQYNSSQYYGIFYDSPLEKIHIGRNLSYTKDYTYNSPLYNQNKLTDVTIGEKVNSLGTYLFFGCSLLATITIPASVTSIGNSAFNGCSGLKELTLKDGAEMLSLGYGSSQGSSYGLFTDSPLETLHLGRNLTYGTSYNYNSPFYNCTTLGSVSIGDNVTSLGYSLFYDCSSLASISVPARVTSIGSSAFSGCSSLASIAISESVTSIGSSAFYGCSSLTTFNLPKNLTTIGESTFYGCSSLTTINFPKNLTTIGESAFSGCSLLVLPVFPESLQSIGEYAFNRCNEITDLHLPSSLQTIGENAFANCSRLKTIYYTPTNNFLKFPYRFYYGSYNNDQSSHSAFDQKSYEEVEIIIGSDKMAIEAVRNECISQFSHIYYEKEGKFYVPIIWNSQLKVDNSVYKNEKGCLVLKESTPLLSSDDINTMAIFRGKDISAELISENGFIMNTSDRWSQNRISNYGTGSKTRNVTLEAAGTLFDALGLNNIQNIKSLTITGEINGTDIMTINRMSSLKHLNLRNANVVEGGATYRNNLKTVNNVIGSYFFHSSDSLVTVILPITTAEIKANAFSKRESIKTIVLGDSLKIIGEEAFIGCKSLTDITIPGTVEKIAYTAFEDCSNLNYVVFEESSSPLSLTSPYSGSSDFYEWDGMMFDDSPLIEVRIGRDLIYKNYNSTVYKQYYNGSTPFYRHKTLASAIISGCTRIPTRLFYDCRNLRKIKFENSPTIVYREAFYNCGINSIELPDSIESIGKDAFYGCTNLERIKLGYNLKSIGENAFASSKLNEIRCLAPLPPVITSNVFKVVDKEKCHLVVTKGNLIYYWLDPVWKEFVNMSDTILALAPLPAVTYGEGPVDLAEYAPEGVTLTYESSNPEVARVDGTKLTIVGAGVATIGAICEETGEPMEIIGQLRQFSISPADLIVTVEDITLEKGAAMPEFTFLTQGLCYDDTLDDLDEMPEVYCEATPDSEPGEYPIIVKGGHSKNYNVSTIPATLLITLPTGVKETEFVNEEGVSPIIEVYNLNGVKVFEGDLKDAELQKGIYIIRKGNKSRKIAIN